MSLASWFLEILKFILCCVEESCQEGHEDDAYGCYVPSSDRNQCWVRRSEPKAQFGDVPSKYHRLGRDWTVVLDGSTGDKPVERIHHEPHHPSSSSRQPTPSFTSATSFSKQPSEPFLPITKPPVTSTPYRSTPSPSALISATSFPQQTLIHHEPHHPSSSSRQPPPSFTSTTSFSKQPSKPFPSISKPPVTSTPYRSTPSPSALISATSFPQLPPLPSPHSPLTSTPSSSSSQTSSTTLTSSPTLPQFFDTNRSPLFDYQPKEEVGACFRDNSLPIYRIPKHIEELIKKDIVPGVLRQPLTYSTYKDYFAALLYAEDYYIEKWSGFELKNVALKLREAQVKRSDQIKRFSGSGKTKKRQFVEFDIDSLIKERAFKEADYGKDPPRRPFLLSRDFVIARPSGRKVEPFKGVVYRVERKGIVLAEFRNDFLSQHSPELKYDISFSFNRVCLKRAHQAISDASELLFQHFLSPDNVSKRVMLESSSHFRNRSAVRRMLNEPDIPHLVQGPLSIQKVEGVKGAFSWEEEMTDIEQWGLSQMGVFVVDAVVQVFSHNPESRILICAPGNRACDVLMTELKKDILESKMFRVNAAFRDIKEVDADILGSCLYEGECFVCPPLEVLKEYPVIFSTFMSSYRLHKEGIMAGHFDCIFLVDASSATEPESLVALANFANERTVLIVTGALGNRPRWVRSDIGRKNGLSISYFERLWFKSEPDYLDLD